jgi:regulator of replication initiation timing
MDKQEFIFNNIESIQDKLDRLLEKTIAIEKDVGYYITRLTEAESEIKELSDRMMELEKKAVTLPKLAGIIGSLGALVGIATGVYNVL